VVVVGPLVHHRRQEPGDPDHQVPGEVEPGDLVPPPVGQLVDHHPARYQSGTARSTSPAVSRGGPSRPAASSNTAHAAEPVTASSRQKYPGTGVNRSPTRRCARTTSDRPRPAATSPPAVPATPNPPHDAIPSDLSRGTTPASNPSSPFPDPPGR